MDSKSLLKGFETYLMLEKSLSAHSVEAYLRDTQKLVDYLDCIEESKSFQARTISGVRAFYKFMLMEDLIKDDPSELLEGPKLARKIPDTLSFVEIEQIFAAIDLSHPQGTRNRAIFETLYASGLRVSELTTLRLSNYFPESGYLKVLGKNNKERIVPIGASAIKHIGLYLAGDRNKMTNINPDHSDTLFLNRRGKGLTRVMIFTLVKTMVKRAGIEKIVSPHTFRHSFATHLVEGGANLRAVQDMLGHESITTTEIYTHLDTKFLKDTIMRYHPRSKGFVESYS